MKGHTANILAIGDICLKDKKRREFLDPKLQKLFWEHDVVTCDLGITLNNAKASEAVKIGPYEQQIPNCVKLCRSVGINMVRLAGNHIMDYGVRGMLHLEKELNKEGIPYIGVSEKTAEDAYKPYICEFNGIKIASFSVGECCFGYLDEGDQNGYAWVNSYQLEENIRGIRDKADWILVFVHAGLEGIPIPMEEWRHRYYTLIDIGADFIIATHAHIVQGLEKHGKGMIAYGLGNFAYDLADVEDREIWDTSIAVSLKLAKNKTFSYEVIPLKYVDSVVRINDEDESFKVRFHYSMGILEDEEWYLRELKQECIQYFERYYYDYYINNAVKIDGTIDYAFLWHNVATESVAYMARRALRELMYNTLDGKERIKNPYNKKYILWGYGKIGRIAKEYLTEKGIKIIGIVDEGRFEELKDRGGITKEQCLSKLIDDENIIVIISTAAYYGEIRDYLFRNLKRRQYVDYQHFIAQIQKYEFIKKIGG